MKIKYNKKLNKFEYSLTKLSPNNWKSSFRRLMNDSEELVDIVSSSK